MPDSPQSLVFSPCRSLRRRRRVGRLVASHGGHEAFRHAALAQRRSTATSASGPLAFGSRPIVGSSSPRTHCCATMLTYHLGVPPTRVAFFGRCKRQTIDRSERQSARNSVQHIAHPRPGGRRLGVSRGRLASTWRRSTKRRPTSRLPRHILLGRRSKCCNRRPPPKERAAFFVCGP